MKRGLVLGIVASLAVAGAAEAQDDEATTLADWLSGNVSVTSDYAFRGISQTLEEPALQGGFDLEHPSGLYLGFWGSSINFGEADLSDGGRGQAEMDLYGGFGFSAGGFFDVDLGAIYYGYPGASDRNYDFVEFGLGASRGFPMFEGGVSVSYSPDFFAESGEGWYYGLDLGIPISILTLSGSVGRQTIESNDVFGTPDYYNYGLGLGVGVAGFDLTGSWVGTDLEEGECFGGSELCESRFIVSIGRAL